MKILFVTADKWPPFRPAAKYIFNRELVSRGVEVDWIIQDEKGGGSWRRETLEKGTAYIAPTNESGSRVMKVVKHLFDIVNDFRIFLLLFKRRYDVVQVKDKYLGP